MKKFILSFVFLIPTFLFSQIEECGTEDICVIEFNASFNKSHDVEWLFEIKDATTIYIDILEYPELKEKHKITTVPTIIVLDGTIEVERYIPNIMLEITTTKEEVQEVVEEILFNKF